MQKRSSRIISETTLSVSSSAVAATFQPPSLTFDGDVDYHHLDLPTYNPLSAAARRRQSRLRSAQNAIHLIPLLLLLCALVLWFFSNAGTPIKNRSNEFLMYGDMKLASLHGDLKLRDLDRL